MVEINQNNLALEIYEACARRQETEEPRTYLGMSQIGKRCLRALWYDYNRYPRHRVDGKTARIFQFGRDREDFIVADLKLCGFEITDRQLGFEDFNGHFQGHCDGVIHGITQKPHILEIKTANDESFRLFEKNGIRSKPEYYAQAQCYMGYSNLERTLFVVENKNNQALYTERIYYDDDEFKTYRKRAYDIIMAEDESPFHNDGYDCKWCDYFGSICTGE